MRVINVTLPSTHEVIPVGDKHLGTVLSSFEGVESLYDYILAKKNRYHIDLGDRIEAITVDDKRYMPDSSDSASPIPLLQAQASIEQDARVAKRMVAVLSGNHELKLWKFGNLTEYMATELSKIAKKPIHYGTYTCVINVSDEYGLLYRLWLSHGFGSMNSRAKDYEQKMGNLRALLKDRLRFKSGNCLIMGMGHTHKLLVTPPTNQLYLSYDDKKLRQHYLEWDGNNESYINPDCRWYFNAGSFLRMYGDAVSYAEMKGYDPTQLGYPIIQVEDREVVGIKPVVV